MRIYGFDKIPLTDVSDILNKKNILSPELKVFL